MLIGTPTLDLDFQNYTKSFGVYYVSIHNVVGFNDKLQLIKK